MHYYSKKEIAKLDHYAVKNGLEIRQMMEIAGFQMTVLFKILKISRSARITIVCGKGNNGGDGLSAARFLTNQGWKVNVILVEPGLNEDAKHHLLLLQKMGVPVFAFTENLETSGKLIEESTIIIDALFGYNLRGNPRTPYNEIIDLVNESDAKIIAYDLPSGIDATGGKCFEPCIQADYTLTLAIPKKTHATQSGKKKSREVYIADIGIPEFLYSKVIKGSHPCFDGSLIKL